MDEIPNMLKEDWIFLLDHLDKLFSPIEKIKINMWVNIKEQMDF